VGYELWDTQTRNVVETFDSEGKALDAVRQLVKLNAPDYPDALALVFEDAEGETTLIAQGDALAARAETD